MRKFRRGNFRRYYLKGGMKQILGIVCAVLGVVIIIQVIPIKAWFFALGILFICIGWSLYKIF